MEELPQARPRKGSKIKDSDVLLELASRNQTVAEYVNIKPPPPPRPKKLSSDATPLNPAKDESVNVRSESALISLNSEPLSLKLDGVLKRPPVPRKPTSPASESASASPCVSNESPRPTAGFARIHDEDVGSDVLSKSKRTPPKPIPRRDLVQRDSYGKARPTPAPRNVQMRRGVSESQDANASRRLVHSEVFSAEALVAVQPGKDRSHSTTHIPAEELDSDIIRNAVDLCRRFESLNENVRRSKSGPSQDSEPDVLRNPSTPDTTDLKAYSLQGDSRGSPDYGLARSAEIPYSCLLSRRELQPKTLSKTVNLQEYERFQENLRGMSSNPRDALLSYDVTCGGVGKRIRAMSEKDFETVFESEVPSRVCLKRSQSLDFELPVDEEDNVFGNAEDVITTSEIPDINKTCSFVDGELGGNSVMSEIGSVSYYSKHAIATGSSFVSVEDIGSPQHRYESADSTNVCDATVRNMDRKEVDLVRQRTASYENMPNPFGRTEDVVESDDFYAVPPSLPTIDEYRKTRKPSIPEFIEILDQCVLSVGSSPGDDRGSPCQWVSVKRESGNLEDLISKNDSSQSSPDSPAPGRRKRPPPQLPFLGLRGDLKGFHAHSLTEMRKGSMSDDYAEESVSQVHPGAFHNQSPARKCLFTNASQEHAAQGFEASPSFAWDVEQSLYSTPPASSARAGESSPDEGEECACSSVGTQDPSHSPFPSYAFASSPVEDNVYSVPGEPSPSEINFTLGFPPSASNSYSNLPEMSRTLVSKGAVRIDPFGLRGEAADASEASDELRCCDAARGTRTVSPQSHSRSPSALDREAVVSCAGGKVPLAWTLSAPAAPCKDPRKPRSSTELDITYDVIPPIVKASYRRSLSQPVVRAPSVEYVDMHTTGSPHFEGFISSASAAFDAFASKVEDGYEDMSGLINSFALRNSLYEKVDMDSTSEDEGRIDPLIIPGSGRIRSSFRSMALDDVGSMKTRPIRPPPPKKPIPPVPLKSEENFYACVDSLKREDCRSCGRRSECSSCSESESDDGPICIKPAQTFKRPQNKLYNIASEILTTERTFVQTLKLICEDFGGNLKMQLIKDPKMLSEGAYQSMFMNIEQIYALDKRFLHELEERMQNWELHQRIGDIIREYGHFLKIYTIYIKGYDNAMTVFHESLQNNRKFEALVREFEADPKAKKLRLSMYMVKPIQRIPSYRLLLKDYFKNLPSDSLDYKDISDGLKIVSEVAQHINESMKEGEKFQDVLRIQSQIVNAKDIVKPGRYLLKEGMLMKLSRKEPQERIFILLTDSLLYCSSLGHNQMKLIAELPLAGMRVQYPDCQDLSNEFSVISTKRSFTLKACDLRERDEWIESLRTAIEVVTLKLGTFVHKKVADDSQPIQEASDLGAIAPPWVPDSRVTMCQICTNGFNVYNRRHHCRACGKVVCSDCSSYEAPLAYMDEEAARVCEKCYRSLLRRYSGEIVLDCNIVGTPSSPTKSTPGTFSRGLQAKAKFRELRKHRKTIKKVLPSALTEIAGHEEDNESSGFLFCKKGKNLRRMWFVLKDHVLYMYKASSDPAASATTPVLGYEVQIAGNWDQEDFSFMLTHPGVKEPLYFKAESLTSAERWLKSLHAATELASSS